MTQQRGRREGVEDLWTTRDGERSKRYGRGNRWRVRFVVEGRELSKSFAKKSDATAYLSEVTTARNLGKFVDDKAGKATVAALYEQWSSEGAHVSAKTRESRESAWRMHVAPRWATVAVGDVRITSVRSWVADMHKAGVGVPTMERAVGVLRGLLESAVEDRRLAANPVTNVKLPRRTHNARGYLSAEQVFALSHAITFRPEVPLFLALTGLRWGEMAALRVSDIDMLRRRVDITRSVTEVSGGLEWGNPKTHERRSVPFPASLSHVLAPLMEGKGRDDLVFTAEGGGVLRVSNWRRRVFDKAVTQCRAADPSFPAISPHDLRHTAASLAVSAGANVKAVQRMLGHAKASMTLDVYADLFDDDLDAVAGALDDRIRALSEATAYPLRTGAR